MKKINFVALILTSCVLVSTTIKGQTKTKPKRPATRNVLWFSPTRANTINGISLSSLSSDLFYENDSVKINGLNVEADPVAFMVVPYAIGGALNVLKERRDSNDRRMVFEEIDQYYKATNQVNGLSISLFGITNRNYNGITVNGLMNFGTKLNGISIGGVMNSFNQLKGISIAGIGNYANKGVGVQIGLLNRCVECKGLQIGLLNKMGKRTLPFINMRFKS
jgi:hypothetical protein